jgi:hypothetical protein
MKSRMAAIVSLGPRIGSWSAFWKWLELHKNVVRGSAHTFDGEDFEMIL